MHLSVGYVYLFLFLAEQTELEVNVVELPAKGATGSLHHNCAALEDHLDCKIYETKMLCLEVH